MRIYLTFLIAAVAGTLTPALLAPAQADIYKFVDRNGVTHLSDRPRGPGYVAIIRTHKGWVPRASNASRKNRQRFSPLISTISRHYRLDQALIHAVITAESAYDPTAVSHAGAVGLMQLMPGTAKRYGVQDRRDPKQNVYGGVRYLRDLLVQFDDLTLALAAYNAGENAVIRFGNRIPPYPETQKYVRKVLNYYRTYRKAS